MRGDGLRVERVVRGWAGSEVLLLVPVETVGLDSFRRKHVEEMLWRGLLLGGRAVQAITWLRTHSFLSCRQLCVGGCG
ncbi:hypothetical protein [Streptomyces sp. TLI_185]|uniref:hypothetical protein n=1 Tax=Streptomyces sp. TLI_185 TaxID=2485151 RepID=UPI000F4D9FBA|nr:hypothetical protein [Streptomyces sp. TLI_185]RPF39058.1 hypothetical protein EDD92_9244 [Streptomyces sp. TLI_185]